MRKTISFVVAGLVALASASVVAQTPAAGTQPVTAGLRQWWDGAKKNLRESAEFMPEANYSFKPVAEVRSFGAILAHVAGANYVICSAAKGEKSPYGEGDFEKTATTRPAIMKALADSLAYCDTAFATDDRKLADMIEMPFGMGKQARAPALVLNIGHLNEHYGNLVTYFRIKGIVPPSSR